MAAVYERLAPPFYRNKAAGARTITIESARGCADTEIVRTEPTSGADELIPRHRRRGLEVFQARPGPCAATVEGLARTIRSHKRSRSVRGYGRHRTDAAIVSQDVPEVNFSARRKSGGLFRFPTSTGKDDPCSRPPTTCRSLITSIRSIVSRRPRWSTTGPAPTHTWNPVCRGFRIRTMAGFRGQRCPREKPRERSGNSSTGRHTRQCYAEHDGRRADESFG
jgi:hypothetical protein